MSRFPQRWRTQRNAIRNANCKTSWIIKILNAHCAFGIFPVACLSECLWIPLSANLLWLVAGWSGFDCFWLSLLKFYNTYVHRSRKVLLVWRTALTFSSISGSLTVYFEFFWVCWLAVLNDGYYCFLSSLQLFGVCLLSNSGSQIKQDDPPNLSI